MKSVIKWQTGTPIIAGAEYIITDKHSHIGTDFWTGKCRLCHNEEDVLAWCLLVDINPYKPIKTMNEIKFNSQICTTKEQSQRLLDLGLKPETADCIWCEVMTLTKGNPIQWHLLAEHINKHDDKHIPAWSLHRLIEILDSPLMEFNTLSYNPYEEIIYNISECIKNGYISKEYLKQ